MCLLRSRRNAAFRCIMVRVRIRTRLHIGVVSMNQSLFLMEMMWKPTIRERIRDNLFLIWFSVIEVAMLICVFLALLDEQYGIATFGAVVLFCSVPFYGMAWSMRD